MPVSPTASQSDASRLNGAMSHGPATAEGRARSAQNGRKHGLRGEGFFLLPGEDRKAFAELLVDFFRLWQPGDAVEAHEAEQAVRAMWRIKRADGLEGDILIERGTAETMAERAQADRALGTLIRYRARIGREQIQAMHNLDALLRRPDREPPDADALFRLAAASAVRAIGRGNPYAEDQPAGDELDGHEARDPADPDVREGQSPADGPSVNGTFEPEPGEPDKTEPETSEPGPGPFVAADAAPALSRQQRRYIERIERKLYEAACRRAEVSP